MPVFVGSTGGTDAPVQLNSEQSKAFDSGIAVMQVTGSTIPEKKKAQKLGVQS
jgi:hypothetical protein